MSLREEDKSNNIHPFEVVGVFVLERRIYQHLQQCLIFGVIDCCFFPMDNLCRNVEGVCGLLVKFPPKKLIAKETRGKRVWYHAVPFHTG